MKDSAKKLLVAQGYDELEVTNNKRIVPPAKWTLITCAILGIVGVDAIIRIFNYFGSAYIHWCIYLSKSIRLSL